MNETNGTSTETMEQQKAENRPDIAFVTCPCCGKPTLPKPVKPNQELVDHWLACMMTGTPFSHAYPIYDGKLTVTVTRLSAAQVDKLDQSLTVLDLLKAKAWPDPGCPVNLDLLRGLIRRLVSIKEIKLHGSHPVVFAPQPVALGWCGRLVSEKAALLAFTDISSVSELLQACYDDLTNPELVSAVPDEMLLAVLSAHVSISDILMSAGFDSNFWKGIELA